MSEAWPEAPPEGSAGGAGVSRARAARRGVHARWIMMVELGSAWRFPRSPAASRREPMEHACPTQYVWIGEETY